MANIRRISQVLFILAFFFLLIRTQYSGTDEISYPVKIFLDLDPLFAGLLLLSSFTMKPILLLSLITVAVSLLLGRFFCGWVCPFGILHNAAGEVARRPKKLEHGLYRRSQVWKYVVLVVVAFSGLFSMSILGVVDPISLTVRSVAVGIGPALESLTRAIFDGLYSLGPAWLSGPSEAVYGFLKAHVLAFEQPRFFQGALLSTLFLGLLALNLVRPRFWCRFVCPLGALLAVFSKVSILRLTVGQSCDRCGKCVRACPTGASPALGDGWRKADCIFCWNCVEVCPTRVVAIGFAAPRREEARTDMSRRSFLWSAGAGLLAVPLLRVSPSGRRLHPRLIRPPGALPEDQFLQRCVKCSECMKVCLTNGLQPTLMEAGLEGMWSPVLVPRVGYCEYSCTLCGQVCPTGAIEELGVEEKRKVVIGLAFIDKDRCLPFAFGTNCIVCEEHCPTPEKAIVFQDVEATDAEGKKVILKQPVVLPDLCIGCGICEFKCPVLDEPAIYVTNINESRSPQRALLLPPKK
ncbi:MAG: 4Fe-4S binding protein [Candidatus Eiseniibacteriota bacterium]|nr:MAG: 4Fe-4S binding protein [Candidatus Eisenbacteria bacterium]